jgi:hypothetical protein
MLKLVKLNIATFGFIKINKISQVEMTLNLYHNFGSQNHVFCYNGIIRA